MNRQDLTTEAWREYDWEGRVYRIENPVALWVGNTTHRILDTENVIHCVPNVGHMGCALRWKSKNSEEPVNF